MNVTIETINGKQYTVVWHQGKERADWFAYLSNGTIEVFDDPELPVSQHTATAIPALPRQPKPDDARLLYRYMAEGIQVHMNSKYNKDGWLYYGGTTDIMAGLTEITHATDSDGNKIEIAIEG